MSRQMIIWLLICLSPSPIVVAQWSAGSSRLPTHRVQFAEISVQADSIEDITAAKVQGEDYRSGGWLRAGFGNCHFGLTFGTSVAYSFGNNIVAIRYISAREVLFNVEGIYDQPELNVKEVGVLFGKSYREKNVFVDASAGLGVTNGADRGKPIGYRNFERIRISTVSIPFEASLRIDFWRLGIGGSWFGNVNNRKSFSGWMFELYIGALDN